MRRYDLDQSGLLRRHGRPRSVVRRPVARCTISDSLSRGRSTVRGNGTAAMKGTRLVLVLQYFAGMSRRDLHISKQVFVPRDRGHGCRHDGRIERECPTATHLSESRHAGETSEME